MPLTLSVLCPLTARRWLRRYWASGDRRASIVSSRWPRRRASRHSVWAQIALCKIHHVRFLRWIRSSHRRTAAAIGSTNFVFGFLLSVDEHGPLVALLVGLASGLLIATVVGLFDAQPPRGDRST